jgi:hypothetical protein
LRLNGTRQLLFCADGVNLLRGNTHTKRKHRHFLVASKEVGVQANTEKTKRIFLCRELNSGENRNIRELTNPLKLWLISNILK